MLRVKTYSLLLATLCGLDRDKDLSVLLLCALNLGVELELHALLGKDLLELLTARENQLINGRDQEKRVKDARNLLIDTLSTNGSHKLDNGDL